MAAPHTKTQSQRDAVQAEVAKLHARGWTQQAIADHLGCTAQTINGWLKKVHAAAAVQIADLAAEKERVLLSLYEQRREAWEAWERSKQAAETTTTKKIDSDGEARIEATMRREGQVGDPAFLARITAIDEAIRKLLGLDAATRIQQEPMPPIDWSVVPDEMQTAFLANKIGLVQVFEHVAKLKQQGG